MPLHVANITPLDITPRSRLYGLEPIGLGTPYVESLTGYAARLAEEHSTTPYYLFSEEVAPLINKPGTISLRVSFPGFAKAADGVGVIAADLVGVFEKLTLRQDLRLTTMLPWATVLSSKSLTREWRAWCPVCYAEQADSGNHVYDQLLWRLQTVTVCVKHNRQLEHKCPSCGNRQLPLSPRIRPGFCARCRAWLGHSQNKKPRPVEVTVTTEDELKVSYEVGRLLEAGPDLLSSTMSANFVTNLRKYVGRAFVGKGVPSQIRAPIGKQTMRCWLRGTQTPSLPLLLKACVALNISPIDLFQSNESEMESVASKVDGRQKSGLMAEAEESSTDGLLVDWHDAENLARVEKRLKAALETDPPLSLTRLTREFRCAKATLRKFFPELSDQVAAKASSYYRPSISNERMRKVIRAALKENPPPPLAAVSRRLGPGASSAILHKRFPDESRRIVERYCSHAKRRLDNAAIERRLRAALKRAPPPSMLEVARKLGIAAPTLHRKFPDLCGAILSRFATYRRNRDADNREKAKAEIGSICEDAVREGVYPSDALVRSRLTVPCQSGALSAMRREIIGAMTLPEGLKR